MLKLRIICLFLLILFNVSVADAKVCFLPGVLASDGCMEDTMISDCSDFDRTTPCDDGYIQESCSKDNKTYYRCTCRHDNILNLGTKYTCLGKFDSVCGCAKSETTCNRSIYPYEGCDDFEGAVPSSEYCVSPQDGKIFYKSCDCPESLYPYDCKDMGLKRPSASMVCRSSYGEVVYNYCDCMEGWSSEPCSESSDGCTTQLSYVYRGSDMGYCYSCGPETCSNEQQKNLDAVFCSVSPIINVDCESIGYVLDENDDGLCSDGSMGLKCVFDSNYIFCENEKTEASCKYNNMSMCQNVNPNAVCTQNQDTGCVEVTGCKVSYILKDGGCELDPLIAMVDKSISWLYAEADEYVGGEIISVEENIDNLCYGAQSKETYDDNTIACWVESDETAGIMVGGYIWATQKDNGIPYANYYMIVSGDDAYQRCLNFYSWGWQNKIPSSWLEPCSYMSAASSGIYVQNNECKRIGVETKTSITQEELENACKECEDSTCLLNIVFGLAQNPSCSDLGYYESEVDGNTCDVIDMKEAYMGLTCYDCYELDCNYNEEDCQYDNPNAICEKDARNCWLPVGCIDNFVPVDGECVEMYESCEQAKMKDNQLTYNDAADSYTYCYDTEEITLISTGKTTVCYSNCVEAYDSCKQKDRLDSDKKVTYLSELDSYLYCYDSYELISTEGTPMTCYTECTDAYDSCEQAGYASDEGWYCKDDRYGSYISYEDGQLKGSCCEEAWNGGCLDEFEMCDDRVDLQYIDQDEHEYYYGLCVGQSIRCNDMSSEKCKDLYAPGSNSYYGCVDAW